MLADYHAQYNSTKVDVLITLLLASCVMMGVLVKRLMKESGPRE